VTTARQLRAPDEPDAPGVGADCSAPLDLGIVAQIVRMAGVPSALDVGPRVSTLWAEPRQLVGRGVSWTVQVRQRHDSGETAVGLADDCRLAARLRPGCDERELAAFVVAQSLRVDPLQPLTEEEAQAAGLAGRVPVSAAPVHRRP
jgi:hypothetical protein